MERDRDVERGDTTAGGDETIQEGSLIIEERMNRREGLVEYEGTVGAGGTASGSGSMGGGGAMSEQTDAGPLGGAAMQAGATILGGTGNTAMVDDATTMSGAMESGGSGGGGMGSGGSGLSMSTDNTASGAMAADTAVVGVLGQIQEGMRVVDAAGDDIGKVDFVKMGDPQAATTMGQGMGDAGGTGDILGDVGDVFQGGDDAPDVEEPMRSQLLRTGFIKVDGKGWFDKDHYVPADQIAGVSGDAVTLTVAKEGLTSS